MPDTTKLHKTELHEVKQKVKPLEKRNLSIFSVGAWPMFCGSHQSVRIIRRPLLATNQFKLLQPDDAYSYWPCRWVSLSNINISADS